MKTKKERLIDIFGKDNSLIPTMGFWFVGNTPFRVLYYSVNDYVVIKEKNTGDKSVPVSNLFRFIDNETYEKILFDMDLFV